MLCCYVNILNIILTKVMWLFYFSSCIYKQMLIWIKVKLNITKRIFPDLLAHLLVCSPLYCYHWFLVTSQIYSQVALLITIYSCISELLIPYLIRQTWGSTYLGVIYWDWMLYAGCFNGPLHTYDNA